MNNTSDRIRYIEDKEPASRPERSPVHSNRYKHDLPNRSDKRRIKTIIRNPEITSKPTHPINKQATMIKKGHKPETRQTDPLAALAEQTNSRKKTQTPPTVSTHPITIINKINPSSQTNYVVKENKINQTTVPTTGACDRKIMLYITNKKGEKTKLRRRNKMIHDQCPYMPPMMMQNKNSIPIQVCDP